MPAHEIDAYLAGLDEPKRSTLEALRSTLREVLPDAEEGLSYGVPAFRVDGVPIAGFAAFKAHLSYFPHSGAVVEELADDLGGYVTSKGALRFAVDEPLPRALVQRLVAARLRRLG
ncbi:MAG: DUF1801 domain-containing protein [Actinobacteria bacterium]|nr:DUF1801 domain-containing protein [Actinomycetota bacterium]